VVVVVVRTFGAPRQAHATAKPAPKHRFHDSKPR